MNIKNLKIETDRFVLRPLVKTDATLSYLSWMKDSTASKYITAAKHTDSVRMLEKYIADKSSDNKCVFLGIFNKENDTHIGNIKYDPISYTRKEAVMGVLLGDPFWRGKNVFSEIFKATQNWLFEKYSIKTIILGVDSSNTPAIRAYEKVGFSMVPLKDNDYLPAHKMIFRA